MGLKELGNLFPEDGHPAQCSWLDLGACPSVPKPTNAEKTMMSLTGLSGHDLPWLWEAGVRHVKIGALPAWKGGEMAFGGKTNVKGMTVIWSGHSR